MAAENSLNPPAVAAVEHRLREALDQARNQQGGATSTEPLSPSADLDLSILRLKDEIQHATDDAQLPLVLEPASRRVLYAILESTTADGSNAQQIWSFLDILLLLCEQRETGRVLLWYLIEELVESQTADCCRIVFDYLDSRRERLTEREFQATHLIILRTCNELLRRLSRAEDATFCGRVFFFLFQIFPLGEQSSVNLRGEFHTDNVTIFDEDSSQSQDTTMAMAVDGPEKPVQNGKAETGNDRLIDFYPVFWSLQKDFSMPTRLLEGEEHFLAFKTGLEKTIDKFSSTPVVRTRSAADDSRGVKRKRGQDGETAYQGAYNPKYLTSKELFELEISDISFQRHILMQALILLDFLLSLTDEAQKRLDSSGLTKLNAAVNYSFVLSDEKKSWAQTVKTKITNYLQQGYDGNFFYRMVSTVLARDKNWIWWKAQRCPSMIAEAVSVDEYLGAREGAIRATSTRRMRAKPMGAMDLTFLSEAGSVKGLQCLTNPARFRLPSVDELIEQASREELDLDFADGEEKEVIQAKIDSLSWRAIRATSRTSLAKLDKLEAGKSLREVLGREKPAQEPEGSATKTPEVQVA